jgi:hypothetical protein
VNLKELFSDGKQTSWLRVFGGLIILTSCIILTWATIAKNDAPLVPVSGVIIAVMGCKAYQSKQERNE